MPDKQRNRFQIEELEVRIAPSVVFVDGIQDDGTFVLSIPVHPTGSAWEAHFNSDTLGERGTLRPAAK